MKSQPSGNEPSSPSWTVFEGQKRIATGEIAKVIKKAARVLQKRAEAPVLVFDDATGKIVEIDFRGTPQQVLDRLVEFTRPVAQVETDSKRGPGRPKLGVVSREVTLLPRHWDWLNDQPGGASVALRKLVEEARRANAGGDRFRNAQDAVYRFMSVMGGNLPAYEEALRALYARDYKGVGEWIGSWPPDIRAHVHRLMTNLSRIESAND
jgi:hypothetical protein